MPPKNQDCDGCDKICLSHSEVERANREQDKRLEKLEEVVHDAIPRMQGRMNLLIQIFIGGLILLVSISGFSFLQLLEFKAEYAADKSQTWERTLEQERRYVDLINNLGLRVTKLEEKHLQKFILPKDDK